MKNFFRGISVLLFVCMLWAGYYGAYRVTERRMNGGARLPETEGAASVPFLEEVSGQALEEQGSGGGYYLKEREGYVIVYLSDGSTVYETTSIAVKLLPEELREEILRGRYLKSQEELYGFLENYSS